MPSTRAAESPPQPPFVVPLPQALVVPSAFDAAGPIPEWKDEGTSVIPGESLIAIGSELHATPIAPAAGQMGQPTVARLPGGRQVHAVLLEVTSEAHEAASAEPINEGGAADDGAGDTIRATKPSDLGAWLGQLRRLGVGADRWTCPDLIGQLQQAIRRPVDRVICALLDTDPWLAVNRATAVSRPDDVAAGLGLLSRLTGAKLTWALFDQASGMAHLAPLQQAADRIAEDLRLAPMENDYPQANPTLIVYATTGRRLRPGRLPTEQGVLLVDAVAAADIGRAALRQQPQTTVPLAVYDQPYDARRLAVAVPGMTVGWVLNHLDVPMIAREVYVGSPLRQLRAETDDVIGAGELTFFAAPQQVALAASPCIRCGWCMEGCPTHCRPAGLLEAAQLQDMEEGRRNGLDACIECGLCTYVCPSRLPILEGIRSLKGIQPQTTAGFGFG